MVEELINGIKFVIKDETSIDSGNTGSLYNADMICRNGEKKVCLAKKISSSVNVEDAKLGHSYMIDINSLNIMKVYGVSESYIYIEKIDVNPTVGVQPFNTDVNLQDVLNLINWLGSAISIMHSKNLVHGDIHLGNILYDKEGILKLIDFDKVKKAKDEADKNIDIEQFVTAVKIATLFVFMKKDEKDYTVLNLDIYNHMSQSEKFRESEVLKWAKNHKLYKGKSLSEVRDLIKNDVAKFVS